MLVNKRLTSGSLELVRFMFPNYEVINENNIPEHPVNPAIYCGQSDKADNFINKYREAHQDYLVMVFYSDINLEDRRILANIIFEKWRNATLPKYLDEIIDNIPYDQFIEMVKIKWVTGKWKILNIDDESNFLDLIEELNKSKFELMNVLFSSLKTNKPYVLESSILTFLGRAKNRTYRGTSFKYRKKLEMYKGKKLQETLTAIDDALEYNIDNPELRLLNLLMNIQDGNKNR